MITSKVTVNGVQYDNIETMPPDVRAIYDQALATVAKGGGSLVKTNEVKFSFELKLPEGSSRLAMTLLICAAAGLAFWFWKLR
jgi:hypothetical protein